MWGLGRTFALEQPDRWGGLLDLPADGSVQTQSEILMAALEADDREDQTAWRHGVRYGARLVPVAPTQRRANPFRPDANLSHHRRVRRNWASVGTLDGRARGATSRPSGKTSGYDVRRSASDRTAGRARHCVGRRCRRRGGDECAIDASCSRQSPPLRGIVHAAVSLSFAPIEKLTQVQVADMLRAKIDGTVLLERLTDGQPTRFLGFIFICCGSFRWLGFRSLFGGQCIHGCDRSDGRTSRTVACSP